MQFRDFWSGMDGPERDAYAKRAGTTVQYIVVHLLRRPPTRVPRRGLLERLVEAANGQVSTDEMLAHFYQSDTAA